MSQSHIRIRGARTHNLKNVSLDIPRDKFVVITGLSGSGKSSLAFDTLYAEGQRRYVESLSAYARQFLSQMEKPEVDSIEGLSPAIAIEQSQLAITLVQLSGQLPKFMTICVCFTHVLERLTVLNMISQWWHKPFQKWLMR
jgi:excinuclease UvrABC ATPase subunit